MAQKMLHHGTIIYIFYTKYNYTIIHLINVTKQVLKEDVEINQLILLLLKYTQNSTKWTLLGC